MMRLADELLSFVRADLLNGRAVELDVHTPLFDHGIVDSLGILRLIAFLEVHIGRPIPDHEVVMEHFRSVEAMARHFGPWLPADDGR